MPNVLAWTVADHAFRFYLSSPTFTLDLPDGRAIALPREAWEALHHALGRMLKPARTGPENRGKPWDPATDERLAADFGGGRELADIAADLGRTRGAVLSRLVRLGLVDEATAGLRYPARPAATPAP